MNALGVEYASSSDDEGETTTRAEVVPSPLPQPQQHTLPPATDGGSIAIDGLPASPRTAADPAAQARIARFLAMQRGGNGDGNGGVATFQENLQTKKEVANPYILDKVVAYFAIDELQTNFDAAVFDPYALPLHEYTDKIASEQKRRLDARAAQQQQRTQIAFTHAKLAE